jgi:hypothetical protein
MTSHERHTEARPAYTPGAGSESAIRHVLAALGHAGAEPTVAELHTIVCGRVRALRDGGALPETVLATMKKLTASAIGDSGMIRAERSAESSALVAQVGQWCIAEYFRKP